jgi:hypothetical protein
MDLDSSIKRIKDTYSVTHGKDSEVMLRYLGTSAGITKPWVLVIDSYKTEGEKWEIAITKMLELLKKDLENKIKMAQSQVQSYQKSLNRLTLD